MISIRCWVNKPSGLDEVDEAAMQEEQVEGVVGEDGEEEEEEKKEEKEEEKMPGKAACLFVPLHTLPPKLSLTRSMIRFL